MARIMYNREGDQGEAGGTDPRAKGNSVPGLSHSMIPPLRYIHKEFQGQLPGTSNSGTASTELVNISENR